MAPKRTLGIRKTSLVNSGCLESATFPKEREIGVVNEGDLIDWFLFIHSHLNA